MDRDTRIKLVIALCFVVQFAGLFVFVSFESLIPVRWHIFAYCIVAISGFAGTINAFLVDRMYTAAMYSGLIGFGLLVLSLLRLTP